ncbi:MAG: PKD domain-containing protein, partial [Sulfuricaulis sp.]|nr:PKD domain-containing protein [Sulfuricaulis sp.]
KYRLTFQQPIIDGRSVSLNGQHNFGPSSKSSIDWGDGTFEDIGFPGKHIYKNPGTYEIILVVSEDTPLGSVEKIASVMVTVK